MRDQYPMSNVGFRFYSTYLYLFVSWHCSQSLVCRCRCTLEKANPRQNILRKKKKETAPEMAKIKGCTYLGGCFGGYLLLF